MDIILDSFKRGASHMQNLIFRFKLSHDKF